MAQRHLEVSHGRSSSCKNVAESGKTGFRVGSHCCGPEKWQWLLHKGNVNKGGKWPPQRETFRRNMWTSPTGGCHHSCCLQMNNVTQLIPSVPSVWPGRCICTVETHFRFRRIYLCKEIRLRYFEVIHGKSQQNNDCSNEVMFHKKRLLSSCEEELAIQILCN